MRGDEGNGLQPARRAATRLARGEEPLVPRQVARLPLPTPFGVFDARAFECASGFVYLALVRGEVAGREDVLTRVHSECLTGDALGSLRCDCGVQLRLALRAAAAQEPAVLVYATGHEGRGIGLVDKLRAYMEQDAGLDTLDANLSLGHAADARDYADAADVLKALGPRSIRLMTNNPDKVGGLRASGVTVTEVVALPTAPHWRNLGYLRTKEKRLGHLRPAGESVAADLLPAADSTRLLGAVEPHPARPYVAVKFAQSLDGRIATASGDARWISGQDERRISHALRAACDAVLVGVGTVVTDDPRLTVRMVPGASPLRVVLDSTLRVPLAARVLEPDAATLLITTEASLPERRRDLRARHVQVEVVPAGPHGVDLAAALAVMRASGVCSLLVEGGSKVITAMLGAGVVDRLIVGVAPTILGDGTDAVGALGVARVSDGIRLTNRAMHVMADDLLLSFDVEPRRG